TAQPEQSGSIQQHLAFAVEAANMQDTTDINTLAALLSHPSDRVRRYAAFALGQIGTTSCSVPLLESVSRERNGAVYSELLLAFGKCGDHQTLAYMLSRLRSVDTSSQNAFAASIARFAIRGIRDTAASSVLLPLLSKPQTRAAAVYALNRLADVRFTREHRSIGAALLSDPSPDVRMWSAGLFGLSDDSAGFEILKNAALEDSDWRVRVNATRALRLHKSARTSSVIQKLIVDPCEHVSLTALGLLKSRSSVDGDLLAACEGIYNDSTGFSWRQRGEAIFILAASGKYNIVRLGANQLQSPSPLRVRVIRALGEAGDGVSRHLIGQLLDAKDTSIMAEALGAYRRSLRNGTDQEKREFCMQLVTLSRKNDPTTIVAIAEALQDTVLSWQERRSGCMTLLPLYESLSSADMIEAKMEFANALRQFEADPVVRETLRDHPALPAKPLRRLLTDEEIHLLTAFKGATIVTGRGIVRIRFLPDAAPFTVLSFIRLAERKFYDGTVFHRVVPNFVIQGGDPLGNGSGGPGYTINTEVHPDAAFATGAVGMASAGKNTEGSQFFITHCPTPHLDGNYTVFAKTEDRIVVDAVLEGDGILGVQLLTE
ncbi:MAG: peptidylprolyl isomerase, partial [Ignavibacteriales bacterium]|nr:peptidylprolyl isomerase [Ignavibacteriales bacterium]